METSIWRTILPWNMWRVMRSTDIWKPATNNHIFKNQDNGTLIPVREQNHLIVQILWLPELESLLDNSFTYNKQNQRIPNWWKFKNYNPIDFIQIEHVMFHWPSIYPYQIPNWRLFWLSSSFHKQMLPAESLMRWYQKQFLRCYYRKQEQYCSGPCLHSNYLADLLRWEIHVTWQDLQKN